jgi:hypothetical protein
VDATITLPNPSEADYTEYVVVLIANHGTPNTLTVDGGDGNINGSGTVTTQTPFISIRVASDGSNYFRTDID